MPRATQQGTERGSDQARPSHVPWSSSAHRSLGSMAESGRRPGGSHVQMRGAIHVQAGSGWGLVPRLVNLNLPGFWTSEQAKGPRSVARCVSCKTALKFGPLVPPHLVVQLSQPQGLPGHGCPWGQSRDRLTLPFTSSEAEGPSPSPTVRRALDPLTPAWPCPPSPMCVRPLGVLPPCGRCWGCGADADPDADPDAEEAGWGWEGGAERRQDSCPHAASRPLPGLLRGLGWA